LSKADPIYSKADQPAAATSTLPPELQGKSADEIAAYYQRREQIILTRARELTNRPAEKPVEKPAEKDDKFDLFGDPKGSIERTVKPLVANAADQAMRSIAPALVNSCKIAMASHHKDWGRWADEVEAMMAGFNEERKTDPGNWEIAYRQVKGLHADELVIEAATEARKKVENPVEKSTPKGADAPKPRVLSEEEKTIAHKFDLTDDRYREAAARYEDTDGALPLTFDSRKPRKRPVPSGKAG